MVHKIQKSGVYYNPKSPTCFGHVKPSSARYLQQIVDFNKQMMCWKLIIGVYMKHKIKDATINSHLTI